MFFRLIWYFLVFIFFLTALRKILAWLAQAFSSQVVNPPIQHAAPREAIPLSGELKKDPCCGTYVSAGTSVKRTVDGETVYFCSPQCRDKFVATMAR